MCIRDRVKCCERLVDAVCDCDKFPQEGCWVHVTQWQAQIISKLEMANVTSARWGGENTVVETRKGCRRDVEIKSKDQSGDVVSLANAKAGVYRSVLMFGGGVGWIKRCIPRVLEPTLECAEKRQGQGSACQTGRVITNVAQKLKLGGGGNGSVVRDEARGRRTACDNVPKDGIEG
eukprot:4714275-Amphidinium_carterae.2